jgi:hypothetical protein
MNINRCSDHQILTRLLTDTQVAARTNQVMQPLNPPWDRPLPLITAGRATRQKRGTDSAPFSFVPAGEMFCPLQAVKT